MLAAMFSGRHAVERDCDNCFFIDRDGTYFEHILNFLRDDTMPPVNVSQVVLTEALYYGIDDLVDILKSSPALFAEFVVRDNIRKKLVCYNYVKEELVRLARLEAEEDETIVSKVRLVTTKNQPIPRDLQFSKQAYKQYYRKFKTYDSFEKCYGKYYVHIPCEDVVGHPDDVMGQVAACIQHDLATSGYRCGHRNEGSYDDHKIRTVTWCDEEFHVCMSCHLFDFDWLAIDAT
ncbi:BTB/POZ domain-containing protein KCTD7-like isoform X2 [Mya arenaria]|nr:BTB/POZ domain-containing protein KCTD7-like isoform X2 [Mya arenaria]XP_052801753.1 BTB/POZ domain-containing protein KCTD7-like isoform X2 [Mya arenaria]